MALWICGKRWKTRWKIVASANPYDFIADGFSLIIEDGEILGIYAKSKDDYSIAVGYKAIQELIVAINFDETVDVKRITKFSHENGVHDELAEAIANMRALKSYTLDFKSIVASYMYTGLVQSGYTEYVTQNDCYFLPYSVTYDKKGNEIHNYKENADYGYHKIMIIYITHSLQIKLVDITQQEHIKQILVLLNLHLLLRQKYLEVTM